MTQAALSFEGADLSADTCTARLARLFLSQPAGHRFSWRELAAVGGGAAWRTRVSNLRREPWHFDIRNQWRTVERDGRRYRESEYWRA